jgi:acyl-CoA synthetase (NDP forming)
VHRSGARLLRNESLDSIFKPSSVAVVGASLNPEKTGHIILKNIIDGGFKGSIYPINPGTDEILGLRAYTSLLDVPGEVDLVVIVVPAKVVPGIMKQAGEKKAGGAIIISGGFREIGNDSLEQEVIDIAKSLGIRIIGPNCQGVNYTGSDLCASWPLIKAKGKMAIISQSGTVGAALGEWAESDGIGMSSCVSLGNKADVSEIDLIEYFSRDPNTSVISLYVEGTGDGRRFMEVCRNAVERKPIVVLRPGRSSKGRKAAESHTKSIAGSHRIFHAACRQVGITSASTVEDLYDFSKSLMYARKRRLLPEQMDSYKVVVLTSSGGSGIIAVDCAEEVGIEIPDLSEEAVTRLRKALPSHCVVRNPLDLTGDTPAERYEEAVRELSSCTDVDAFLLIFGDPIPRSDEVVARLKSDLASKNSDAEIVVCYIGGGAIGQEEALRMHQQGIPVYSTPERAMRAIGALAGKF